MTDVEDAISEFLPSLHRNVSVDILVSAVCKKHDSFSPDEVKGAFLKHIKPTVTHKPIITKPTKPKMNSRRYRDLSHKKQQKVMTLQTEIVRIIEESPNGMNKSAILSRLRKENSHWRPIISRYLLELEEDGIIQTDGRGNGTLYYPYSSQVQNRERRYHRLIAETLQIHGDMTMTQLSRKIGCDGGRNRHFLRDALRDLEKEGWIAIDSRNRWKWCL